MSKKISLALNTLVCSDSYGLGYTLSRVQRTSACELGKVDVRFDEDVDADEFTGRTRTSTDEDGNVTEIRYRTMLVSYLDWDIDDETEEIVGGEHVSSYGGEVFTVPYVEGKSSTALINKFTRKR